MIVQILEKLEFNFNLEFNILEFGEVEFFSWLFCWILSMIVVILEDLEFDFDLEFNIVELGEVEFFFLDFLLDFEYNSGDFGKVGI